MLTSQTLLRIKIKYKKKNERKEDSAGILGKKERGLEERREKREVPGSFPLTEIKEEGKHGGEEECVPTLRGNPKEEEGEGRG